MSSPELNTATVLAIERTRVAYERTMMAWVRTGTSLIAFGFTVASVLMVAAPDLAGRVIPVLASVNAVPIAALAPLLALWVDARRLVRQALEPAKRRQKELALAHEHAREELAQRLGERKEHDQVERALDQKVRDHEKSSGLNNAHTR